MTTIDPSLKAEIYETMDGVREVFNLPSREQQAHKLWADSCIELQRIEKMLAPAFERHQKALDACAEYGSENRLRMNPYMQEAWMTWEAKQLAAAERAKGK